MDGRSGPRIETDFDPADATGTFKFDVVVASGSVLRAGIYEDAITPSGTDLDLFVYRGETLVGAELGQRLERGGDGHEHLDDRHLQRLRPRLRHERPSAAGTLFTWVVGTTRRAT